MPAKALHRMVYRAKAGIRLNENVLTPACAGVTPDEFFYENVNHG